MLPILSYKVYWDAGYLLSGNYELLETISSYDHYFYEAKNLQPGVFYSFQVSATNAIGESVFSIVISHFAQAVPGKPLPPYRVSSFKTSEN